MRRIVLAVALSSFLAGALPLPATAQTEDVSLRLLSQSPWNSPSRPLSLQVAATNRGTIAVEDLSLAVTFFAPARSRLAYEDSLSADPPAPLFVDTRDVTGSLEAGATRTFRFGRALDFLTGRTESSLYPMKVELRSSDVPVATLRTPLVFVVGKQKVPLAVATTVMLSDRLRLLPDGAFADTGLEQALADRGWLSRAASTLASALAPVPDAGGRPLPANLVVSPLLLMELERMADGYRVRDGADVRTVSAGSPDAQAASRVLRTLRRAASAPAVDLAGSPLTGLPLPALAGGTLGGDLALQYLRGHEVLQRVLGMTPTPGLVRPPLGALDRASLDALRADQVRTVLLDPGSAEPPEEELGFSPVATGRVVTPGSGRMDGILPSLSVDAVASSVPDPVLRAQVVVGELAAIYFERPGVSRGVALSVDERDRAPADYLAPLLAALRSSPFLRPLQGQRFLEVLPPEATLRLVPKVPSLFPASYETAIERTRARIESLRSLYTQPTSLPDQLGTSVLFAESEPFLRQPAGGLAFLEGATHRVSQEFAKLRPPPPGDVVTLASRNGRVPITIRNLTGSPVRLLVTLQSSALSFPEGPTREIDLPGDRQTLIFQAQAKRGGRFRVDVRLSTPDGASTVSRSYIVVRSTAYNQVALIITLGAAAFLLLRWARRFLPRARS